MIEDKFQYLTEYASDLIFVIDKNGHIVYSNPRASSLFNLPINGIVGKKFNEFFPIDFLNKNINALSDMNEKEGKANNILKVNIQGTEKWLSNDYISINNHPYTDGALLIVSHDITDLKKQLDEYETENIELKNLNDMKDRLVAILAHDLKNPLYSILGLTEMFTDEKNPLCEAEKVQMIQLLSETSKSAISLLNNLLLWGENQIIDHAEVGLIELNLYTVVENNLSLLKHNALRKSINISNFVDKGHTARGIYYMVDAVIRNLLDNAIKFTDREGAIEINSVVTDCFVEVTISDNGVGIAEEDIKEIFKFGRSYNRYGTQNEKGSGIGLILCKSLIEKLGGEIVIDSKKGKGSKIKFKLLKA